MSKNMTRTFNNKNLGNQKGITLIVSLVLLVILTILVLGSLRGAAMNSKMASNAQVNNAFNTPIDGEIYAQMDRFANGNNATDSLISDAIAKNGGAFGLLPKMPKNQIKFKAREPDKLNNTSERNCANIRLLGGADAKLKLLAGGKAEVEKTLTDIGDKGDAVYDCLSVSMYDLTKDAKDSAVMPYARNSHVYSRLCVGFGQGIECKNIGLNVKGQKEKLGTNSQTVGFGVVAPKNAGIQGIVNES